MERLKNLWLGFAERHPKASQWVREGGLFVIVSNVITVFKWLLLTFWPLAFAFVGTRAAEGDILIQQAIVADLGGFADDDAHAVVDDQTSADFCRRMDFHTRSSAGDLGNPTTEKTHFVGIKPVGKAVINLGMQTVVQPKNFKLAACGGVIALVGFDGFDQSHKLPPNGNLQVLIFLGRAKDFFSDFVLKTAGILCVFQGFATMRQSEFNLKNRFCSME